MPKFPIRLGESMSAVNDSAQTIIDKALSLGASLVGFARVKDLKIAPSFTLAPKLPAVGDGIGTREASIAGLVQGEAFWPENAKTVLVIALSHPEDKPDMDWWFGPKMPTGNRVLVNIMKELGPWIESNFDVGTVHLPYHVEKGGTYLKDAAVMAGLGCVGKNNLLVTPEFGPRVRLRAMILDTEFPPTGPKNFDPCSDCPDICRKACPQSVFEKAWCLPEEYDQDILPGRDGRFSRPVCTVQMEKDEENRTDIIKYCRKCEFACPVGNSSPKA